MNDALHAAARAASEKVYDDELARRDALIDAAAEQLERATDDRDKFAIALATSEDDLRVAEAATAEALSVTEALRSQLAIAKARIAELEAKPTPPVDPVVKPRVAGAVVVEGAIPDNARIVTAGQDIAAALNAAPAGGVVVLRGGVHAAGLHRIVKPLIIQAYPGETPVLDGGGVRPWSFILKAKTIIRGLTLRNFPDSSAFEKGLLIPDGGDGSLVELCRFEDHANQSLTIFQNRDVQVLRNSFARSGTCHIGTDRTTDLIVDQNLLVDANRQGREMQPTTSAMKHTRAKGLRVRHNIIDGAPKVGGIWLDVSCYDFHIIGNDIRAAYEQIQVELCGAGIIAGNRVYGPSTYNIRVFDSSQVAVYNNETAGGRNVQVYVAQDERRNDGSEPYKADGVTWLSKDNEIVNNIMDGDFTHSQLGVWDDRGVVSGLDMVTRIAGNILPPKKTGTANPVLFGNPARKDYTIAGMEKLAPARFTGNASSIDKATPQVIPDRVADALGMPRGSAFIGAPHPAPIRA